MLKNQLTQIRAHPMYKNAMIKVILESNMTYIHSDQVAIFMNSCDCAPLCVVDYFDPMGEKRYGVFTSKEVKIVASQKFSEALVDSRVRFASDFIKPFDSEIEAVQGQLCEQLGSFRDEIEPAKDPIFGKSKRTLTGKSAGRPDDLAQGVQLLAYWITEIIKSSHFRRMQQLHGWVC